MLKRDFIGNHVSMRLDKIADWAIGSFSNQSLRELCEPLCEPLPIAFPQVKPARTTNVIALPETSAIPKWRPVRIAIKAKGKILLVNAADVIAVEAKGNYVLLHHTSSSHNLRESISAMEQKLTRHGFVRIHRSILVNATLVEEILPRPAGECMLRLKGGREYTVTRTYKQNLQLLAQSWIGTDGFITE